MLILVGDRFEFGERLLRNIEAQCPVRRGHPHMAFQIDVQGTGRSRHRLGRDIDVDLFAPRIDLAQSPVHASDVGARVEPERPVFVARHAVAAGSEASDIVEAKLLHGAGLSIDPCNRGVVARQAVGDPQIAVEIGLRIVHADHAVELRRRSERPVAAVVRGRIRTILLGEIVFPEHGARRLARWTRAKLDLHRAFAGATRARQIDRQFLLVKFDVRRAFVIGPEIIAEHVDVLHQIQDRVPASLIELVLQRIARAMAAGAVLAYLGLHPEVFRRVARQRLEEHVARQLPHEILHRLEEKILAPRRREIDAALGRLVTERLRPNAILCGGHGRKIVNTRFVGKDARRDGSSLGLGRYRHTAHFLA